MSLTSEFLTNGGITNNFKVQYEASLPNKREIVVNGNALLNTMENEFTVLTGWFNTPQGKFGASQRQIVNLSMGDVPFRPFPGGRNAGYSNPVDLDAQNIPGAPDLAPDRVAMLFVLQWSQVLMSIGNQWPLGNSTSQALARWCAIQRFASGYYSYTIDTPVVEQWLNSTREDWVNRSGSATDDGSVGGALAFLFYLTNQLGFDPAQIVQAGGPTLAATYASLTGDLRDPFPAFAATLACAFPPGHSPCIVRGQVRDNPFPQIALSFVLKKATFSADEVAAQAGPFVRAFFLQVDGLTKSEFAAKNIKVAPFIGSFAHLLGLTITQRTDVENPSPRRMLIPFDVTFSQDALKTFPTTGSVSFDLNTFLTCGADKIPCTDASATFTLTAAVQQPTKEACGKVTSVTFDAAGKASSFELHSCCGETHQFKIGEPGIAELALLACQSHLTLCVTSDRQGISSIAVTCC